MKNVNIKISIKKTTKILAYCAILLVVLSSLGQFSKYFLGHGSLKGLVNLFYLNNEENVPTLFSTLLLIFIAFLLLGISILNKKQKLPFNFYWIILSIGFFYLSIDEAFSIHEKFIDPMRDILAVDRFGFLYYAWVLPGIAIVILFGLFFLKFLKTIPKRFRWNFVISASIYVSGIIGFELIGGYVAESIGIRNLLFASMATIEESLEMTGLIIFIWSLLNYYSMFYSKIQLDFKKRKNLFILIE